MIRCYFMIAIILTAEADPTNNCHERETTSTCAGGIGKVYKISYAYTIFNMCVPLVELCHNEDIRHTYWAHHRVHPSTVIDNNFDGSDFAKGRIYEGVAIDRVYEKDQQLGILQRIVGDKAKDYIELNQYQRFLATCQLAANKDFNLDEEQLATFHYLNTVPIWQTVKQGNWFKIEDYIREYSNRKQIALDVWTGTFGLLTLPDNHGIERNIYLDGETIPVPKILFKVVRDRKTDAGVVFVTVNNPYLSAATINNSIICKDISSKFDQANRDTNLKLKWQRTTFSKGFSYACEVDDFRRQFNLSDLPSFSTNSILF